MDIQYALEIQNLTVVYDLKPVLFDVNLKLPKSKLIAILGPNGAGKTTLIKSILNLVPSVLGTINIANFKKTDIAYVPQSSSVDWDFPITVLDVVLMGCYGNLGFFKRPSKKDHINALKTLDTVGMSDYKDRQISKLSGGQQQRVFLARALMQNAEIYFLDEPFKGVDAKTELIIINLLKDLKNQGKTLVVVHHDLKTVSSYFDWVTFVNGKIIANGKTEDVFTKENIEIAYNNFSQE